MTKGLEFEHVLIPEVTQERFGVEDGSVDERNLLYVGMTRTKATLTLLYDSQRPSRFLFDAGLLSAT
jgi:superfamily I DNA/RNA helicase